MQRAGAHPGNRQPDVDEAKKQDLFKAKAELEADGGPIELKADKKKDKKKKKEEQEGEPAAVQT